MVVYYVSSISITGVHGDLEDKYIPCHSFHIGTGLRQALPGIMYGVEPG
jgi:hypothetical protein